MKERCEFCAGTGKIPTIETSRLSKCIACNGKGRIEQEEEESEEGTENDDE